MKKQIIVFIRFVFAVFVSSATAETLTNDNSEIDLLDSIQVFVLNQLPNHDEIANILHDSIPAISPALSDSIWQKASFSLTPDVGLCWLEVGNRGMWENLVVIIMENDIAGRLLDNVAGARVLLGDGELTFSISLGVAECLEGEFSVDNALAIADKSLYSAKEQGSNRVCS